MKMPFFVAMKTELTSRAARIEDRMEAYKRNPYHEVRNPDGVKPSNRNDRRFYAAFVRKCSVKFGGLKK